MKLYKRPVALTSQGWHTWEEKVRAQFPIQSFFREDVREFFRGIQQRVRTIKWWIIHRIHPKHRYHVIKPKSLTPGYYDFDTRIFHSAFDLLCEYVDTHVIGQEWTQKDIDDEEFGQDILIEQVKNQEEQLALYHWWKNRPEREKMWDCLPELTTKQHMAFMSNRHEESQDPVLIEYRNSMKRMTEYEIEWEKEDQRNFHRLVDIYRSLWY